MLKYLFSLFLFLFLQSPYFLSAAEKNTVLVDRCVAVVNDDVITLSELEEEAAPILQRVREQVPEDQVDEVLQKTRKDVLAQMIDRKLLFQRADKRGVIVSDAELDAAIERILEENRITADQFRSQLAQMGTTEEIYRQTIKGQIVRSKLIGYEIRSKVVITDEQIEAYYKNMQDINNAPDGYHILQFGSSWGENGRSATPEEARKRAEQVREMILAGDNFKDLAQTYSDLPSGRDGGDIGFFAKNELATYMWDSIKDLRPGMISQVIETPAGYQFFKLISYKIDGVIAQAPLNLIKEEIRATLYDQELKKNFEDWVKLLREHSYIEELL